MRKLTTITGDSNQLAHTISTTISQWACTTWATPTLWASASAPQLPELAPSAAKPFSPLHTTHHTRQRVFVPLRFMAVTLFAL